ncbi:conserved Plasmodium protein, unknown function [Plasmodium berghei]|uniref:Leucine-rich repeat protein n=2 Tax=Plasmodium berghei TaxID=5821 RepID=A0A509ARN1_PLABA|nr:conserved Plasmodium protein, unknown function [Plasmodium berghei ANKA]CXI91977.1 conserved Plasmodium protein, unknown function [Plasmodium berghei]SCL96546.1 conserved Plasmodium protein, unknown function [Plasmodium berghei]SCM16444.1 conserved Plasmodium protein, unknown function [Plasmodium berghei]SCM18238.1 conserved Plasmodium protein, unknown function [Plasmodium berghei]SCN27666.1 conserved Plasmodium protein, unknown function [Plasmodium berghei]|eukprot:XP_034423321.1 conserved Plasmodium protein, unknown function [Plasmodium berghei ANKA]
MNKYINTSKAKLKMLNDLFVNATENTDICLNKKKDVSIDPNFTIIPNDNVTKFYNAENNYIQKIDNIEEKENDDELKFVTNKTQSIPIINPSYIRERNFNEKNKYIDTSFVNNLAKISTDDIGLSHMNNYEKKYYSTYNNEGNYSNNQYINATNEYYITKSVEEKIPNTGIPTEHFVYNNGVLQYEDSMKNWTSNSRYLYFIEKEKEKDEKRKETKLKDITLKDSIIPDKYEKILLKYDFISDKTKMDNLILDVLNNKFEEDTQTYDNTKSKEEIKSGSHELKQSNEVRKNEGLNVIKNKNTKYNRYIISDYLHYYNYFNNDINHSHESASDSYEYEPQKNNNNLICRSISKREFKNESYDNNKSIYNNEENINIEKITYFIPENFAMNIFLPQEQIVKKHDTYLGDNMEPVLKIKKIRWNKKKIKFEKELLQKYNYVDNYYSHGYCTRIANNLMKKFKKERINIYDIKTKKMNNKAKEDIIEEENLRKMRLNNLLCLSESAIDEQNNYEQEMENTKEESYKTDSYISFDDIDNRSINNLKKKYKVLKKSDNDHERDLKKLKFYLCKKLNKKKYIKKPMKIKKEKTKKEKIQKIMKYSSKVGYNLLAQLQKGELKAESEEESELSELEEGELFDDQDKNTEDLNSSEYTYSSLTLSFSEYLNIREAYYNDNSYEKIFYPKDPKMNVTYIYDTVDFYNISKGKILNKRHMLMEMLIFNIKFYERSNFIKEEDLSYSFEINENWKIAIEKKTDDIDELVIGMGNNNENHSSFGLSGDKNKIRIIYNNINKRILLAKYIKYLNYISSGTIDNAAAFFLYETDTLDLRNVQYDKVADSIICLHLKNFKNIDNINIANRSMDFENLCEFLSLLNIKQYSTLNLSKNPLFLDLTFHSKKKDIDCVIDIFKKNVKLNELIIDFVDLSNPLGEYFITSLLLNTNITFLSLINCNIGSDNIKNIINALEHRKVNMIYPINYINIEFNNLTYYDIISLIKTLCILNKNFKKLYICGNLVQENIFDVSFAFKRKKKLIEMDKYNKQVPDLFHFDNIYDVKNNLFCNLRGTAELTENSKVSNVTFELYLKYLYIMAPEDKLYTIRNITTIKRRYQRFLSIVALHDKKEINIQLNLFRENNITLFNNLIKKSFHAEMYYNKQVNANKFVNENILNYFSMRIKNELNFYHYNVTPEEIHYVLDLCKKNFVKNINLSCCYLTNDDILYFNTAKNDSYKINVYNISLNNNLFTSDIQIDQLIKFISNFSIYFKINLNNLNIGANSSTYKLFFYILNDTKSKIVMLDNCNLGNSFLFNVNKNIQDVNTNDYLNVLSMQYNEFNNKKEMLKFLNKIIIKCKQIKKIKIFSNYITEEETKLIAKHIIKKNIVSFEDTYDVPSSHKRNRKFSKLSKKINNIDCNTELTPNEIKKITEFFQKEQKNGINDNKHNSPLNDRYHLSDLKTKNIKNSFIKK